MTGQPRVADTEIPAAAPSPELSLTTTTTTTMTTTRTASMVLDSLPRDLSAALAEANDSLFPADQKVIVRFKPVGGSAPPLPPKRELSRISAGQKFEVVVGYLRRLLKVGEGEAVFLYVNATFAPALDEVVGNLWQCFKDSSDQLNVGYSLTPAFG